MNLMTRRRFLSRGVTSLGTLAGAAALGGTLLTTRMAFGAPNSTADGRFVFIILRGALDGLSAVPPYGDAGYSTLRGSLALPNPGTAGGLCDSTICSRCTPVCRLCTSVSCLRS